MNFFLAVLSCVSAAHGVTWRPDAWMGDVLQVIPQATLLDLSLPGTHDSLTYDLSETISDDSNDLPPWVASLLHIVPPNVVDAYIRKWAMTQRLNVSAQLDAGMRFIDFRAIYTNPPTKRGHDVPSYSVPVTPANQMVGSIRAAHAAAHAAALANTTGAAHSSISGASLSTSQAPTPGADPDPTATWYGLHLFQTNEPAIFYLNEIRTWVDSHPTETIVLYISRHGGRCPQRSYDAIPEAVISTFYSMVQDVFGSLLWDLRAFDIVRTPILEAQKKGARVILMMGSYDEFVYNATSPWLALNTCRSLNESRASPFLTHLGDTPSSLAADWAVFQQLPAARAAARYNQQFTLITTTIEPEVEMVVNAAAAAYIPFGKKIARERCAGGYKIRNMTDFCPQSLEETGFLGAYYQQRVFDATYRTLLDWASRKSASAAAAADGAGGGSAAADPAADFPHAIYTDVIDVGGIQVTSLTGPPQRPSNSASPSRKVWGVGVEQAGALASAPAGAGLTGYAYAATMAAANLLRNCDRIDKGPCFELLAAYEEARSEHPVQLWNDGEGHNLDWPKL